MNLHRLNGVPEIKFANHILVMITRSDKAGAPSSTRVCLLFETPEQCMRKDFIEKLSFLHTSTG